MTQRAAQRVTKYRYLTVIQGNYAGYWEDVSEYSGPQRDRTAYTDIKEYRIGCSSGPHRIVRRRELRTKA